MRRLAASILVATVLPACVIGPRPVRHSVNASLLGAGTTLATAVALDPCVMHEPGLLNFDRLCDGIHNGGIAFGVGLAVAGLFGFVANAFDDSPVLDSHDTK